ESPFDGLEFRPVMFWAIRQGRDEPEGIDDDTVVPVIRDHDEILPIIRDEDGQFVAVADDRTSGIGFLDLVTEAEHRDPAVLDILRRRLERSIAADAEEGPPA